jgi:hypothetical protein
LNLIFPDTAIIVVLSEDLEFPISNSVKVMSILRTHQRVLLAASRLPKAAGISFVRSSPKHGTASQANTAFNSGISHIRLRFIITFAVFEAGDPACKVL